MKRSVIIIIGLIVLVVSVAFYMAYNQEPETMIEDTMMTEPDEIASDEMVIDVMTNDGKKAEDFELVNLAGESVSLDELSGARVYVKFWA